MGFLHGDSNRSKELPLRKTVCEKCGKEVETRTVEGFGSCFCESCEWEPIEFMSQKETLQAKFFRLLNAGDFNGAFALLKLAKRVVVDAAASKEISSPELLEQYDSWGSQIVLEE